MNKLLITLFIYVPLLINPQEISFSAENPAIKVIINKIESQTDFKFAYGSEIDIVQELVGQYTFNKENIEKVVQELSDRTSYTFSIIRNNITITTDPAPDVVPEKKANVRQPFQMQVEGKVTDANGMPLPSVTVQEKGTSNGVLTDFDGNYSIQVSSVNSVLLYTYVGMQPEERLVDTENIINVQMQNDLESLDEVVVTALGVKREARSLGYSASTVDTEELTAQRNVNVGNNLVGKVAGLNVTTPTTGPAGTSKIRIRGQSSFGGDNSPLIIVNGVPINNSPAGAANDSGEGFAGEANSDSGDGLQSINPEDIESMTVLKGAAAAALYGFRAKDGAIIITTKSGAGSTGIGVEFNSSFQADYALDFTDFQYEYGQGEGGVRPQSVAEARSSGVWSFGERFDGEPTWQLDGEQHPYLPHKNRIDTFYDTGITLMNTVALSGGDENGSFRLSFSNTDVESIVPNSSFDKNTINIGVNYNLTDKFSTQLNANYSNEDNLNPPVVAQQDYNVNQTLMTLANSINPEWMEDVYEDPETGDEINPARFRNRTNMYFTMANRFENRKRDRLFGNVSLRYLFTPWLYAQGRIGQDYFSIQHEVNRPTGTAFLSPAASGFNGNYYQDSEQFRELNMDFLIGAEGELGDFGFDALVGANRLDQTGQTLGTSVTNFYVRDLYTINNGQIKNPSYSYFKKRVNSIYGTAGASFRNLLFINFTGRNDWFSTLNPDSNSYFYPSVSSSFVFTEAMGEGSPDWLSFGKLRAAYAEVGGDTDPYANQLFYNLQPNEFNGTALGGIQGNISPNQNLRPLKVKEAEVGLNLGLFSNRVTLDMAVYRKNTEDEILDVDISVASGFEQTKVNVGRLRNEGVEALLSISPVRNDDLRWETSFNYAYNKSEVLELAENQQRIDVGNAELIGNVSHEVGMPMASLRGRDYLRDEEGNIITVEGRFQAGDLITYGSAIPKHVGGWINNINYKGFSFFSQVDFKAGHKMLSNSNFNWTRHGLHKMSLEGRDGGVVMDAVNPDGTPNTTPVEAGVFWNDYRSKGISTPFVYDASFVRWRTVSLGYDFSEMLGENSVVQTLNLRVFVNNVLVISKSTDNLDPEAAFSASDNLTGLEYHGLPTARSYGLNLNIKL
ncbi:SusC/RagA family TonB-linked outer membrane protein [Zunongwangia sp. F260]|uniref:SusC/RagA family TonB-linked outer membrane protein n=1 Tax=Autumnicola lenta TaxID=3075593 RepID=A0ABU3CHA7_9FLAO|nr:SusC/RagA family TonB-linked outer membrane protein [Zunongwangia sp. F260]MDT0645370.1 SusC/RagA family TonB-linked outer membrane protein [Zunongwangia sp. F260]